ncbi:MAG TPA: DNA methyltransferase [Coriobacteriia bacterium]|nr:DNA methyltransferase [Coriobacteriia bacterium]
MSAPYWADDAVTLYHGDCLDVLRTLPDASVDSIVTDPPYGLEFMGKEWDAPWRESDVNADAGMSATGYTDGGNRLERPSFTGSTNPKCLVCKGTRRGRRDGTAKVAVCLCDDGGHFPNVRAVEMRAFQDWCLLWAVECLRVLKPGGMMLAFGGTRTWHRLACAVEDAGFEIRDSIAWLYGSGFPKSLDVSKAIDKAAGAEREIVGCKVTGNAKQNTSRTGEFADGQHGGTQLVNLTAPATPDAARWRGWGTALKPAFEPIVVARRPLAGTVAANVLAWGTGALNVDGCRVGMSDSDPLRAWSDTYGGKDGYADGRGSHLASMDSATGQTPPAGRWPTNVVLDDTQAAELDRQSGVLTSGSRTAGTYGLMGYMGADAAPMPAVDGDTGGASRFFPIFKQEEPCSRCSVTSLTTADAHSVSTSTSGTTTREVSVAGELSDAPRARTGTSTKFPTFRYEAKAPTSERPFYWRHECGCEHDRPMRPGGACETCGTPGKKVAHPTVKPLDLMRWLVRLVTPPGGLVLDPFAGSGTTGEACVVEGFRCVLIENDADSLPLIVTRLSKPIAPVLDFGGVA